MPRKGQRGGSPNASGKNTSTHTPKPQDIEQADEEVTLVENAPGNIDNSGITDPLLLNRHYETIDESKGNCAAASGQNSSQDNIAPMTVLTHNQSHGTGQPISNPAVAAVKSGTICQQQTPPNNHNQFQQQQRPKNPFNLVSDANSTSSGASDMSDYIETLSSCSRGSSETVTSIPVNSNGSFSNISTSSSGSPRKSSNMKPRSGKEYFKIDRSMFRNE